jgi:hypothetical protein
MFFICLFSSAASDPLVLLFFSVLSSADSGAIEE